jgi:hypothetical protein
MVGLCQSGQHDCGGFEFQGKIPPVFVCLAAHVNVNEQVMTLAAEKSGMHLFDGNTQAITHEDLVHSGAQAWLGGTTECDEAKK